MTKIWGRWRAGASRAWTSFASAFIAGTCVVGALVLCVCLLSGCASGTDAGGSSSGGSDTSSTSASDTATDSTSGTSNTSSTSAGSTSASGNTLVVGVRSDVVGFGSLNEQTGKYYGLEIDIAREMATRMGYDDITCVTVTPDTRKDMLLAGEVDCIAACYSISDSRLENFDFSPVYYTDESVVVVESSSLISDISEMAGHTFGTMGGSNTSPQLVQKLTELGFTSGDVLSQSEEGDITTYTFDTFTLVQYPSYSELSDALEEGSIDGAALDYSIAKSYLDSDRIVLALDIYEQDYGIATQKDSALSSAVSETIQAMLDDGTIASLTDKWN